MEDDLSALRQSDGSRSAKPTRALADNLLARNLMPQGADMTGAERPHKSQKVLSHLIVLGHPNPHSLNAAIAQQYEETVRANHQEAVVRDLYSLGFDPLLKESERTASEIERVADDVRVELDLIERCDVLSFVFPLWFGMPPAMIKGYVDRVLGAGFRTNDVEKARRGVFQGKRLAVLTTSASTLPWLEEHGMWVSLRQSFDRYLATLFGFAPSGHYHADAIVDDLSPSLVKTLLEEVDGFTRSICTGELTAKQ